MHITRKYRKGRSLEKLWNIVTSQEKQLNNDHLPAAAAAKVKVTATMTTPHARQVI